MKQAPLLTLSPTQWHDIERRLTRLAAGAGGGALLTVTLALGEGDAGRDWLDRQPREHDFCYWAQPARQHFRLGIGRALVCTSAGPARFAALQAAHLGLAQHWRHDDGGTGFVPVACLGFAFDEDAADILPNAQLGVAAVLLCNDGGRLTASFTTPARAVADAPARWRALLATEPGAPAMPEVGTHPDPTLARQHWQRRVTEAPAGIASAAVDKVVLSRTLSLSLHGRHAPQAVLRRLLERHCESTIYGIGNARGAFVGATPERLVALADGRLATDALAGTAWNDERLDADKNVREQGLVVAAIREALAPLCASLVVPAVASVLALRDLRHLWTPITGTTLPGVGLFDLVARLHPTPAVGGWPTAAARDWLRRHEARRPGWYGGGIGWISRDGDGEVAVALRCGLFGENRVELVAGAGIVAGSTAEQEFAETEIKLRTMLDALYNDEKRGDRDAVLTGTR